MDSPSWGALTCSEQAEGCLPDTHMHFARFLLPLPSHVPVPDGMEVLRTYDRTSGEADATTFTITAVRQVEVAAADREQVAAIAAFEVLVRLGMAEHGTTSQPIEFLDELQKIKISVADVITTVASLEEPPPDWNGTMQNLAPENDALMRCLHSARDIVRAVALTGQPRVVSPSYERLPVIIMLASATKPLDGEQLPIPTAEDWQIQGPMLLEHTNMSGWEVTEAAELDQIATEAEYWARNLAALNPAARARELMIQSRRYLHHEGEYALAVVVATTATEVLMTSLLSVLMWEESWTGSTEWTPEAVAAHFGEGKLLSLVKRQLIPRLGGTWSTKSCPWEQWISRCRALRNRIVHGGHDPSRAEVQSAIDSVDKLQEFVFDRLSARADKYPRAALMLVSEKGLRDRKAWSRPLERFARETADEEAPWIESFGTWHSAVSDSSAEMS